MLLEFLAPAQLALMHVRTARESAALATDDRDLRLGVEVEAAERIHQMPHQIVAKRVEPVGPVQGQGRDLIAAIIFDQSFGHFSSSLSSSEHSPSPGINAHYALMPTSPRKRGEVTEGHQPYSENFNHLSSQMSSKRQPLYWLLLIIVSPLTSGCQQVAARR